MVTKNRSGRAPAEDSNLEHRIPENGNSEHGNLGPWADASGRSDVRPAARDLQKYRAYLLLLANRQLSPELRQVAAPSDLVQESLIEAQQSLADFAGRSEEQFLGWLRRILLNNLADHARRRGSAVTRTLSLENERFAQPQNGSLPLVDPQPTPAGAAMAAERVERLKQAVEQLPDEYREIIRLRNFELLTFAQIGERLGKAAGTVCRTWYRAIEQLQGVLGDSASGD